MIDGGDAVGDRLPVAVEQRHIDRKIDAGARHHLPLERIAMQVDDARQHQETAGIEASEPGASRGRVRADGADLTAGDPQRGFLENSSPSRARPPSINMSVTMRHLAVWLARAAIRGGLVFGEKILDRELAEIGQGAAQRLMVPVPPGERRRAGRRCLPETAA